MRVAQDRLCYRTLFSILILACDELTIRTTLTASLLGVLSLRIDDEQAVDLFNLRLVIKELRNFEPLLEFVHLDGVPGADFLVQAVLGFGPDQLQLDFLGHRVGRNGLFIIVIEPIRVFVVYLAGLFVLMNFCEIVAVTHLTTNALVVVDKYPVGLESPLGQLFVEQIDAIVHRAMGFAYRRTGATEQFSSITAKSAVPLRFFVASSAIRLTPRSFETPFNKE